MTVRRSIILLACAALFACASAGPAAAGLFSLAYQTEAGPVEEHDERPSSGTSEGSFSEEFAVGFECRVRLVFKFRWFIRKVVETSRVGTWNNLRFEECTNEFIVRETSGPDFFRFEREFAELPTVRGIYSRFLTFSILFVGPMDERCQYTQNISSRETRYRVTFIEQTRFVSEGTLVLLETYWAQETALRRCLLAWRSQTKSRS